MTNTGLEKIKRAADSDDAEDKDLIDLDHPTKMQKELMELKEERKKIQKEIEKAAQKTSRVKMEEAETLDNAKKTASKFADLHWVIERFTY